MHKTIGKARVCGALALGLLPDAAMAQGRTFTAADYILATA